MRGLSVLVAPFFWSLKNDFVRFSRSFYKKLFFYVVSSGIFIFLMTTLLNFGMARLQKLSPDVFNFLLLKGYSLIFMVIFFIQIINGVVISFNTFYQSKELEVLFTSPVNRTSLFFSRLFETHAKTSWMLIIFGMPMLMSLGLFFRTNLIFYGYSLLLFTTFSIIPVNIGIGCTILLSSIFHIRKMKKFLLSAGLILAIILITFLRVLRPERFVNPELFANLTLFLTEMKMPSFILMPNRWLGESIFNFVGRTLNADTLLFIASLFLTSYVTGVILLAAFKRYHYKGWVLLEGGTARSKGEKLRGAGTGRVSEGVKDSTPVKPLLRLVDSQSRMLIKKDLLYQIRDEKNIQQIVVLLVLIVIYLFSISALPVNWEYYAVQIKYIISFFNLGLILIIIASLCSRIVYPAVVSDADYLWIIKTSPATSKRYSWTKFIFFFIPVLIVGQLLIISSSFLIGIEKTFILLEVVTTTLVCASFVSMAVFFGIFDMKKIMTDTHQEQMKTGSTAYMLSSIFLILLTLALEIVPTFLFFFKEVRKGIFTQRVWPMIGGVIFALLLINFFITIISTRLSTKKIDNLQLS
jgi:ABC-2 type transport system permease protein